MKAFNIGELYAIYMRILLFLQLLCMAKTVGGIKFFFLKKKIKFYIRTILIYDPILDRKY